MVTIPGKVIFRGFLWWGTWVQAWSRSIMAAGCYGVMLTDINSNASVLGVW